MNCEKCKGTGKTANNAGFIVMLWVQGVFLGLLLLLAIFVPTDWIDFIAAIEIMVNSIANSLGISPSIIWIVLMIIVIWEIVAFIRDLVTLSQPCKFCKGTGQLTEEGIPQPQQSPQIQSQQVVQPQNNQSFKYCRECGKPVIENSKFCMECGTKTI